MTSVALWWRAGVLAVAGTAVYWNSLSAPLVLDDQLSIAENHQITHLWRLAAVFSPERELPVAGRPLVNLSLAINYAIGGVAVRGYHLWNIAVHVLCAIVLFGLVRRTLELPSLRSFIGLRSVDLAFAVSLVWMLHPLNTETIDYITQRTESMMAFFYLLTLYAGVRAIDRGSPWALVAVLSCASGMACKESMATAPVTLILYDGIFVFDSVRKAVGRRWKLYAALAATWVELVVLLWTGPRIHSAGFTAGIRPWTYLLDQTVMITRYLRLAIWPHSLVVNYGPPFPASVATVLPYAIFVVTLIALTVVALVWRPALGFLGASFFLTLAPTSSVVPIATEVGAERRMYLALVAVVVFVVLGAYALSKRGARAFPSRPHSARLAGAAALATVAVVLGATTIARNRDYTSSVRLAQTVLDRWPTGVAQHMMGVALIAAGRPAEAIPHLREAMRSDPRARYTLGVELFNERKLDEAVVELRAFVSEQPLLLEVVPAREMIGRAFAMEGEWSAAVEEFRRILQMIPGHVDAQLLLGDALFAQQAYDEAVEQYRDYLRFRPNDTGTWTNIGIACVALGRLSDGVAAFRRVIEINPGSGAAHRNLATALYDSRDINGAAAEAQKAVALAPGDAAAHDLLGRSLALQGHFDAAKAQFERSLEIDPAYADAREDFEKLRRVLPSRRPLP